MGNYVVYMHINKENGKRYVGITCQKISARWGKNGKAYLHKNKDGSWVHPAFGPAIEKYGWDGFDHLIILSNVDEAEAKYAERYLIKWYHTNDGRRGYNCSGGGDGGYIDGRTSDPDYDAAHSRKYRSKNPEKIAAYNKKYRAENQEKIKALMYEWRAKNEEHIKEYDEQYKARRRELHAANPEKARERQRRYREKHREEINARERERTRKLKEATDDE